MEPVDLNITCADGVTIRATLFKPSNPQAAVMIAPATGIKRGFYKGLATYLAESGIAALIFDNRGIGDSLNGPISKCSYNVQQWGSLDMPAVLKHLRSLYPDVPYHLVGHSAGGQLVGLMHNAMDLSSMVTVAASSGSLRNMSGFFKLQAYFFMNVYIPVSNWLWGHTKSQWVGMGEPLPSAVAAQWSEWCNGSGYVQTAFGQTIDQHWYNEIKMPSLWLHAADDPIAVKDNVLEMIAVYQNMPAKLVELDPRVLQIQQIGHMKFFSRKSKKLWSQVLDWILNNNQPKDAIPPGN